MSFEEMLRSPEDTPASVAPAKRVIELRRPQRSTVGGPPQVSLLPREMRDAERQRGIRRGLVVVVVAAALATGAGIAGAAAVADSSATALANETARSQTLGLQVLKFADVQKLQQRIALGEAAVRVGSSTAIDWQKQLAALEADMPEGFAVTTVVADGATPTADYEQGVSPLDRPRAATVSITATTPSIDQLPVWLRKLRSVPAYGDVTPQISGGTDGAGYNVLLTIHLTDKALVATTSKEASR